MLAIGGAQGPGMPSGGKGAASSTGQLPAAAAERTSQVPAAAAAATRDDMVHAEVGRLRRKVKILTDVLNDIILRNDLHVNPQLVQQLASISDDVAGSSAPPTSAPNNSGAPPTTTLAPLTVDSEMVESWVIPFVSALRAICRQIILSFSHYHALPFSRNVGLSRPAHGIMAKANPWQSTHILLTKRRENTDVYGLSFFRSVRPSFLPSFIPSFLPSFLPGPVGQVAPLQGLQFDYLISFILVAKLSRDCHCCLFECMPPWALMSDGHFATLFWLQWLDNRFPSG
jgi:hypothetical protein